MDRSHDRYPTGTVTFAFTDVVQSTRLWADHHDAMREAIAAHDEIVRDAIDGHRGVMVKQTGDGAFAVFASAFDALEAVMSIRATIASTQWEEIGVLGVRIGMHTGEAELRDGDYFGLAVNRAARVMSLADGGEVLLSLSTQEVVRDRLPDGLELEYLGERELRGITRPELVFGVVTEGVATKSSLHQERTEDEQAQRAAWIAVLPFGNLSGDPEQQYFADGIAEDVITGLAAFRSLRVVARTSSFRFRDSQTKIPEIAKELGVRYVVEGSVRKAGNRVRVTAQLVEATDRRHLWAERYDGDLDDIFDVQDRITEEIVVAINPAIRYAEAQRVSSQRPESLTAWDHVQQAWSHFHRHKPDANVAARRHFDAAVELDPGYAEAMAGLSATHFWDGWLRWADEPAASFELAYETAKAAVALDDHEALAHASLAMANYGLRRLDAVLRAAQRAIDLNPSLVFGHAIGATAKVHGGDPAEGVAMITRAIALSPQDPGLHWFYGVRAIGHFLLRDNESAIADARRSIELRHGYLMGRIILTAALADSGNLHEAGAEIETLVEIYPDFTPEWLDQYVYEDEDRARLIARLQEAGLES